MKISSGYVILKVMDNKYGERLALALKLKNLKQADLAKKLKINQSAISKIIKGVQYLDFDLAVKACEILGISLNWLAYGSNREPQQPFYRDPERQRVEYLMSIIEKAEYPLVIVALEEMIEIRLKDTEHQDGAVKPGNTGKSGKSRPKK